MARRLRDAHRARHERAEHLLGEVRAHLVRDLRGEVGAPVVHGEKDGRDVQPGVEVHLDHLDVLEQLAQPLERVVLALDGDEHLVSRDERVDGEQPEARRAVDEDVVEALVRGRVSQLRVDRTVQTGFASDQGDELDLRAGEVDRRRRTPQAGDVGALGHDLVDRRSFDDDVVDARHVGVVLDAESSGSVALRVDVDDENLEPRLSERRRDVHGRRRLPDAALLICDREHPRVRRARQLFDARETHARRPGLG